MKSRRNSFRRQYRHWRLNFLLILVLEEIWLPIWGYFYTSARVYTFHAHLKSLRITSLEDWRKTVCWLRCGIRWLEHVIRFGTYEILSFALNRRLSVSWKKFSLWVSFSDDITSDDWRFVRPKEIFSWIDFNWVQQTGDCAKVGNAKTSSNAEYNQDIFIRRRARGV